MKTRIITALTAVIGMAGMMAGTLSVTTTAASAHNGDPAGEVLPVCATDPFPGNSGYTTACVDRTGWGVSVVRADGTSTGNYGPAEYTYLGKWGHEYHGAPAFYFHEDAQPYGPAEFPDFDY